MCPQHLARQDSTCHLDDRESWLVVGLGNPGSKYAGSRHNLGYLVTDYFVAQNNSSYSQQKLSRSGNIASVVRLRLGYGIDAPEVIVAHTGSFMNNSGSPTQELLAYYKIPAQHLLVVHDDIDLDFGVAKLKIGGSDGGHNGLKSIQGAVGTRDFARLRLGVGRPPSGEVINWVLGKIPQSQQADLESMIERASQALHDLTELGLVKAQARLHLSNPGKSGK